MMTEFFIKIVERKAWRFGILFCCTVVGVVSGKYASPLINYLVDYDVAKFAKTFAYSMWTLLALWFFRTYDTQKQVQQANFATGMENLASDNPLAIDIGVVILLEVSNTTSAFDKEIRLAFIKRLKSVPKDCNEHRVVDMYANRLTYAQHILWWLVEYKDKNPNININLSGMDCSYQEFKIRKGKKLKLSKLAYSLIGDIENAEFENNENTDFNFIESNCEGIDFNQVVMTDYSFCNSLNVIFKGAYLFGDHNLPKWLFWFDECSPLEFEKNLIEHHFKKKHYQITIDRNFKKVYKRDPERILVKEWKYLHSIHKDS